MARDKAAHVMGRRDDCDSALSCGHCDSGRHRSLAGRFRYPAQRQLVLQASALGVRRHGARPSRGLERNDHGRPGFLDGSFRRDPRQRPVGTGGRGRCGLRDRSCLCLLLGTLAAPPRLGGRLRAIDACRPGHFAEHVEFHDRRDGVLRRSGVPRVRGGRPAPLRAKALGPGGSRGRHGVLRLQYPRVRFGGAGRSPSGPDGARPAGMAGLRDCRPRRHGGLRPYLSVDCPVTGSSPRVAQPSDRHVAPPAPCLVFHIQLHRFATSTSGAESCLAVPRATRSRASRRRSRSRLFGGWGRSVWPKVGGSSSAIT